MATFYMHTINGHPAGYVAGTQICYAPHYGKAAVLVRSLREIRQQQRASNEWRKARGMSTHTDYGYVRVAPPADPRATPKRKEGA